MYRIHIQIAAQNSTVPNKTQLRTWAKKTLQCCKEAAEITIRIVDIKEMTTLNETYRHKKGATNVLSFPFEAPPVSSSDMPLGDIVICAAVVSQEAAEQNKSVEAHWAHMIVHGIFHLLGYDHETDAEAEMMESKEIAILKTLGFANPYVTGKTSC